MLTYLLSLAITVFTIVVFVGVFVAVMSTRFKSWRPVYQLYLKLLRIAVTTIATFLWKPEMVRAGIGHMAAPVNDEET